MALRNSSVGEIDICRQRALNLNLGLHGSDSLRCCRSMQDPMSCFGKYALSLQTKESGWMSATTVSGAVPAACSIYSPTKPTDQFSLRT